MVNKLIINLNKNAWVKCEFNVMRMDISCKNYPLQGQPIKDSRQ